MYKWSDSKLHIQQSTNTAMQVYKKTVRYNGAGMCVMLTLTFINFVAEYLQLEEHQFCFFFVLSTSPRAELVCY